jgi:hypothetical protein
MSKTIPAPVISDKPSDKFRNAMRQILSVPKTEIDRREVEYRAKRGMKRKAQPKH